MGGQPYRRCTASGTTFCATSPWPRCHWVAWCLAGTGSVFAVSRSAAGSLTTLLEVAVIGAGEMATVQTPHMYFCIARLAVAAFTSRPVACVAGLPLDVRVGDLLDRQGLVSVLGLRYSWPVVTQAVVDGDRHSMSSRGAGGRRLMAWAVLASLGYALCIDIFLTLNPPLECHEVFDRCLCRG